MDAIDSILNQFQEFINRSPRSFDAPNENTTIFPRIEEKILFRLFDESQEKLQSMDPLIRIHPPLVYVGDIHGNLTDLLHIFHIFGLPPKTKYLFLGDYVDRGLHSIQVIAILLALVCKYPNSIYLLRGNHEFKSVNRMYGFYEEVLNSYGSDDVWVDANTVFGYLPLAAIVGDQVFCVHGGLSPLMNTPSAIQSITMPVLSYDTNHLIADLVWSDPVSNIKTYEQNSRGTGVFYGPDALSAFLRNNKLKIVIRAHQCVANGYSLDCQNMCITLFSSSNYCRLVQNRAAVIHHNDHRELEFYTIQEDSVVGLRPKTTMNLSATVGTKGMSPTQAKTKRQQATGGGCPRPPSKTGITPLQSPRMATTHSSSSMNLSQVSNSALNSPKNGSSSPRYSTINKQTSTSSFSSPRASSTKNLTYTTTSPISTSPKATVTNSSRARTNSFSVSTNYTSPSKINSSTSSYTSTVRNIPPSSIRTNQPPALNLSGIRSTQVPSLNLPTNSFSPIKKNTRPPSLNIPSLNLNINLSNRLPPQPASARAIKKKPPPVFRLTSGPFES